MNRINLFIKYLKNNRIKEYDKIIQDALSNDYQVISLRDYVEKNYDDSKKLFVLRHDIDQCSDATRMMFEIEKKYGVYSSFYFRNSTFNAKLMKEIEAYGSEASLHFEPIADFVKANNIQDKEELFKTIHWEKRCLNILKDNIDTFRNLLSIPCITIASHGEYENRLVKVPNNYLTEDIIHYDYLGIKLEAYNKNMIHQVTSYISDMPIEINDGYRYGVTPMEAIERGEKFIMFLSHPNHWYYIRWQQFKKIVKVLIKKPIYKIESFKRI
jgi:hypothetical protein